MINEKLNHGFFVRYEVPTMNFPETWIGPFEHRSEAEVECQDITYDGVIADVRVRYRAKDGTWHEAQNVGYGMVSLPPEEDLYQGG